MSEDKLDLRKNYFQTRDLEEVGKDKLLLDYAFKIKVIKSLERIVELLEKGKDSQRRFKKGDESESTKD